MNDAALVQRVLAGDSHASTELFDRHAPACLRYATRMLGNREDAEDATQESFLRAYRALDRYEPTRPFRAWLMRIVVNRCRTALVLRSRRDRRVLVDEAVVAHLATTLPAPAAPDEGITGRIAGAIAQLDPLQREAFLLKHVEELSYDEMMHVTGAGASALKMRVKRACERLRELLEEDDALRTTE